MMCNFVARTNWSNIESNYFMHTIIVFNLPYDTNVPITVTFVNLGDAEPYIPFVFARELPAQVQCHLPNQFVRV